MNPPTHADARIGPASTAGEQKSALRILFADDDVFFRHLVQHYLQRMGHLVRVVSDGTQAIEAVRSQSFDVVVLDLLMPRMDGIEAARNIRAYADSVGQSIPIIAATSHRPQTLEDQRNRFDFDAVLSKPLLGEEFVRVLAELAERAHA
jgi:CheY-like chemotaxis protein